MNLKDKWELRGSDLDEFYKNVRDLTNATTLMRLSKRDVKFLSLYTGNKPDEYVSEYGTLLTKEALDIFIQSGKRSIEEINLSPEMVLDARNGTQLIMRDQANVEYVVSPLAFPTFMQRTGVGGDATTHSYNLYSNMHSIYELYNPHCSRIDESLSLVCRKDERGNKKIFAAFARYYNLIPQTTILDLLDVLASENSLGKYICKEWQINHAVTSVQIEFPEAADAIQKDLKLPDKFIPGIFIQTSDIGVASFTIRGTLRRNGDRHAVVYESVDRKHTLSLHDRDLVKDIEENIFVNVRRLPEKMLELYSNELHPEIDLTSEDGVNQYTKLIRKIYERNVFGLFKKIPKKMNVKLVEELLLEIDPTVHLTQYDVAAHFFSLPSRVSGLDDKLFAEFQKICAKAPFKLQFEKEKAKAEDLVLLPE